ncbi:MAG: YHS domain-containing protein [Pseudomonadota bacterium]
MKTLKLLVLALVLGIFAAGAGLAADPRPQTVCPVLGGNIDQKVYVDYQGERIYFCCPGCDAEFRKNPEKYMKKIQEQGITLEKSPEAKK